MKSINPQGGKKGKMGLTVHWELKAPANANPAETLNKIAVFAKTLSTAEVSEVKHFEGDQANFNKCSTNDPDRWLKIQATKYSAKSGRDIPKEIYALSIWPGEGCEEMNIGLAKYPYSKSWTWRSFCKTQYADEFVKCHLSVITILDFCKHLGIVKEVHDEGDYWETRDIKVLAGNINESTTMIQGLCSALRNAIDGQGKIESPIDNSQNYILNQLTRKAERC